MGDISEHLDSLEVRCKGSKCCGGTIALDAQVAKGFERLRQLVGKRLGRAVPIAIGSGFRCRTHNNKPVKQGGAGGSPTSTHCRGWALDLYPPAGLTVDQFAGIAENVPEFENGGIGRYAWGIHVDIGPRRRWDLR